MGPHLKSRLLALFSLVVIVFMAGTFLGGHKVTAQVPQTPTSHAVVMFSCNNQNTLTLPLATGNFAQSANAPTFTATDCAQLTADYLNAGFTIQSPDVTAFMGAGIYRTMVR